MIRASPKMVRHDHYHQLLARVDRQQLDLRKSRETHSVWLVQYFTRNGNTKIKIDHGDVYDSIPGKTGC